MPDHPSSGMRLLAPAQVAELLAVSVEDVMELVTEGQVRGVRVGTPQRWRIEEESVNAYLDDQAEEARRMALWRQSNAASFPELWGRGDIRSPD